jgi:hypothetical protein
MEWFTILPLSRCCRYRRLLLESMNSTPYATSPYGRQRFGPKNPSARQFSPRSFKYEYVNRTAFAQLPYMAGLEVAGTPPPYTQYLSSSSMGCQCSDCSYSWSVIHQDPRTTSCPSSQHTTDDRCFLSNSSRSLTSHVADDVVEQEPPTGPNQQHSYPERNVHMRRAASERSVAAYPGRRAHSRFPPPLTSRKRHTSEPTTSQEMARPMEIEISPGIKAHLRGSHETRLAILRDFYDPIDCACCGASMFVIRDAGYVICPFCKVISPVHMKDGSQVNEEDQVCSEEARSWNRLEGGVGLGFDFAELQHILIATEQQEKTLHSPPGRPRTRRN